MLCIRLKNDLIIHNNAMVDFGYPNCCASCFGNYRFSDLWFVVFLCSFLSAIVCYYPFADLRIRNVSIRFSPPFSFRLSSSKRTDRDFLSFDFFFVFCLNTWNFADLSSSTQNSSTCGSLKYYVFCIYPRKWYGFCICHGNCSCGSATLHVIHLVP